MWGLLSRIRHVFSAKHPKLQHFFGDQVRAELWIELAAQGSYQFVLVASLHAIVDGNSLSSFSFHPIN